MKIREYIQHKELKRLTFTANLPAPLLEFLEIYTIEDKSIYVGIKESDCIILRSGMMPYEFQIHDEIDESYLR